MSRKPSFVAKTLDTLRWLLMCIAGNLYWFKGFPELGADFKEIVSLVWSVG